MITNINWYLLINWLLPVRLRTSTVFAWLMALLTPVRQTLYGRFKNFERKAWYQLKYQTGQVAYLEFVLNEAFDPVLKRIRIAPGTLAANYLYIFLAWEAQDLSIFRDVENEPVFLYSDMEYGLGAAGSVDFVIKVPYNLPTEELTLRALADRYKRDGKSYSIQYVN